MKRSFIKRMIVLAIISTTLLSVMPIAANAYNGQYSMNQIWTTNEEKAYADSYQWVNNGIGWKCATPDFHQGYANAWICTNGVWYYVAKDGYMLTNVWVNNYYVDDGGAWVPNATKG
ncbi:hypothetical protein [Clostridium sp.]|uniref:hypothetical protein n=1 Tax=Clostridium sp. TaxID=1506 RepID=UPI00283ABCDC|nr:hypothetical protein [Clostridium sp.]MDR3594160.1 hypothetical protein [Clostridium sp.]